MHKLDLKRLYRDATRGLPQDGDLRVTTEELLALARGETLGARHDHALAGVGASSESASVLKIATATEAWSLALAADLARLREPTFGERVVMWFKSATLPPVFAACAISLLAVGAWRISEPGIAPMPPSHAIAADDSLFGGNFDEAVAHQSEPDALFGADFDS